MKSKVVPFTLFWVVTVFLGFLAGKRSVVQVDRAAIPIQVAPAPATNIPVSQRRMSEHKLVPGTEVGTFEVEKSPKAEVLLGRVQRSAISAARRAEPFIQEYSLALVKHGASPEMIEKVSSNMREIIQNIFLSGSVQQDVYETKELHKALIKEALSPEAAVEFSKYEQSRLDTRELTKLMSVLDRAGVSISEGASTAFVSALTKTGAHVTENMYEPTSPVQEMVFGKDRLIPWFEEKVKQVGISKNLMLSELSGKISADELAAVNLLYETRIGELQLEISGLASIPGTREEALKQTEEANRKRIENRRK